jgi:hypothetical protein
MVVVALRAAGVAGRGAAVVGSVRTFATTGVVWVGRWKRLVLVNVVVDGERGVDGQHVRVER